MNVHKKGVKSHLLFLSLVAPYNHVLVNLTPFFPCVLYSNSVYYLLSSLPSCSLLLSMTLSLPCRSRLHFTHEWQQITLLTWNMKRTMINWPHYWKPARIFIFQLNFVCVIATIYTCTYIFRTPQCAPPWESNEKIINNKFEIIIWKDIQLLLCSISSYVYIHLNFLKYFFSTKKERKMSRKKSNW